MIGSENMDNRKENSKTNETRNMSSRPPRSPKPPALCTRKNSFSRSLQNIFHRKRSYNMKQSSVIKGKKLYETINDARGVNLNALPIRRSSKARVWSVRNSLSKSPMETMPKELLKLKSSAKVKKKIQRSKTCSHAFDTLHYFKDLLQGETLSVRNTKNKESCIQNPAENFDKDKIETDKIEADESSWGNFDETSDRSRLSSFGSSACYSETSVCCSLSSCSYCNRERSDSGSFALESDSSISTSYWDLRLPSESPLFGLCQSRRYSLDVETEHCGRFGSPEIRAQLAKRRLSEQPRSCRSPHYTCWQDKFLDAMAHRVSPKNSDDISELQHEVSYNKDIDGKSSIDIPKVHKSREIRRSNSACVDIKRSKSISRSPRSRTDGKDFPGKAIIKRTRSMDSSSRRRQVIPTERHVSKSPTCQFAFSDIESSEESESTHDPKESSSEDRHQSSLNDTSSLSACSVSGSSGNEHNIQATKKKTKQSEQELECRLNKYETLKDDHEEIDLEKISSKSFVNKDKGLLKDNKYTDERECITEILENNENVPDAEKVDLIVKYAVNGKENQKGSYIKETRKENVELVETKMCMPVHVNPPSDESEIDVNSDFQENRLAKQTESTSSLAEGGTDDKVKDHATLSLVSETPGTEDIKVENHVGENIVEMNVVGQDGDSMPENLRTVFGTDFETEEKTYVAVTDFDHNFEDCAALSLVSDVSGTEFVPAESQQIDEILVEKDNEHQNGDYMKENFGTDVDTLYFGHSDVKDENSCRNSVSADGQNEAKKTEEKEKLVESFYQSDRDYSLPEESQLKINNCKSSEKIQKESSTAGSDISGAVTKDSERCDFANTGPEIDEDLNYFDSVLNCEVGAGKGLSKENNNIDNKSNGEMKSDTEDVIESDEKRIHDAGKEDGNTVTGNDEHLTETLENESESSTEESIVLKKSGTKIDDCQSQSFHEQESIENPPCDINKNNEEAEFMEKSYDVIADDFLDSESDDTGIQNEGTFKHGNLSGFHRLSMEEVLFNIGKIGVSPDNRGMDDMLEAINREVSKEENKDKDMMVMFIVGGELKVLRRSGTLANGSHGDLRQPDFPSMTRKESPQNGSRDYVLKRSVHDINRGRPKSAIIVTRSQSFNGMANQQGVMGGRRESPQGVVLGESFRHHRPPAVQPPRAVPGSRGAVGFSFKKSPKVPKVPRPNRALLMFQSVKRGIREFIEATKEDINQLQHRETDHTSTAQGKLHEADKQIKSAERYLKRLEFHLAKLDELHEFYLLQQQLREGVRTMHRAYVTSPGNQSHSLSNVKYGYKECTQNMCNIEAQLEAMMGTFNCKLKGMAGFARLCPGDVFEVTVRHGTQKWKTKGRIEKTGNQKWDIPEFTFKAVVGDIFNIKGLEVRAFKSVLLGQKSCETKDLFSANPQLMTVSINVNGSLKLSIVITWNPLDGVDDSFTFMEGPQKPQGTPRRRPVSVIALNGQYNEEPGTDRWHSNPVSIQQTKDDNFILRTNAPSSHLGNNVTSYHGLDSPHVSARLSDHLPEAYRQTGPLYSQTSHHVQAGFHSSPAIPSFGESDSDKILPHPPTQNSAFSNTLPSVLGHLHFPSVSPHAVSSGKEEEEHSVLNIEDVLHTLSSSLEDYHGQYTELQRLEDLIKFAQKLIRKQFRSSSRSSSISVSIESALEAFDFLDTEETFEEPKSPSDNVKASFDDMLCSPESTAKTGDSGIESLAQRLSEDTQLGSSLGSSPVPPSTGNEEVDQCLMYHLTYCERLLENLGAFGPLKCREIYALDKLQKQCTIIESLLKLAKAGPNVDLHQVMSGICEDKALREFWVKCTDQNSLYIHPDRLLNMLEQKYSTVIAEKHMMDPVKVSQHVITRVLDIPDYEAERGRSWFVLTLHQFMLYFNEEKGLKHIEDVAAEMKLVEKLTTGNPDIVIKAILTLRDTLPSSPCLKVIAMLLVTMDKEVEQCTLSYLNLIQKKKEDRHSALLTFVEGLEDRTPEIRAGACAALAILEATESIDQLVYLWQSDSSAMVQKSAKEALLKLGDEGRKALEEAQLSKHGFQGIQVHK